MSKPREFWVRKESTHVLGVFYAWNEEGSRNRNKDCMKVIEKSAYDKAIEALKLYVGVADRTQKGPTYYSIAEHTLKELGELD